MSQMVIMRPDDGTGATVTGEPRKLGEFTSKSDVCPECDGHIFVQWEVEVSNPLLIGGKGIAMYMRCKGCTYQSPMAARSLNK